MAYSVTIIILWWASFEENMAIEMYRLLSTVMLCSEARSSIVPYLALNFVVTVEGTRSRRLFENLAVKVSVFDMPNLGDDWWSWW